MKLTKLTALLLTLAFLTGCVSIFPTQDTADAENTFNVYRIATDEAKDASELIQAESLPLSAADREDVGAVLDAFLSESRTPGLSCPLPENVTVENWSEENGVMTLVFSPGFADMSAMDRTVAAFCATLTMCELEGVEAVTVMAGSKTLFSGLIPEDALLRDTDTDPYARQLRLYFADADERYLISEHHSLTLDEDASAERYVMEELLRGPNSAELVSLIPRGTTLLSCITENGVCTVNLSSEFYDDRPQTAVGERLVLYSIVDSLTALSAVDSVRILVEGTPVDTYVYRSLAEPLARYEEVIGPVSSVNGELDVDIWLPLPGLTAIAALPFRVSGQSEASEVEAILSALLNSAEPGYPTLFSGSGTVVSLSLWEGSCTVELSEGFLPSLAPESRGVAIRAIAATLCAAEGINSVRFIANGAPAAADGTDWSGPWTEADLTEVKVP